jgi:predicted nucleotidyltransferase component of viral defense system
MPRLSVDLDFTYFPQGNREVDSVTIQKSLNSIKQRLKTNIPAIRFVNEIKAYQDLKLICARGNVMVKVEINPTGRGLIATPRQMSLCTNAQERFTCFCEAQIVADMQLWGGKINAALDRQHPRDLFDVKNLFDIQGFTDDIKKGVLFFMMCSGRPFHELLQPQRKDRREIFTNQFGGMTDMPFSYKDFDDTRERLIETLGKSITLEDKALLVSFAKGAPQWTSERDYSTFPAVQWKLLNILHLKEINQGKFEEQIHLLEDTLAGMGCPQQSMSPITKTSAEAAKESYPPLILRSLGGVHLSVEQQQSLKQGGTIVIEGATNKSGKQCTVKVHCDKDTGKAHTETISPIPAKTKQQHRSPHI